MATVVISRLIMALIVLNFGITHKVLGLGDLLHF